MTQAHIILGDLGLAEEFLIEFQEQNPDEDLVAAAQLENIRIQILKERWPEAIDLYGRWLEAYPNHSMVPKVRLDRAWTLMRSGRKADAIMAYRDLAEAKLKTPEVYAAKIWLADQNFNSVTNRSEAEKIYLVIASETNCPPYLRHRSQLMAGRAALARDGYDDARKSFVSLLNDTNVSETERIQATFALGDLTMIDLKVSPADASLEAKKILEKRIHYSTNAFYSLIQPVKTNIVAARAWGRIGDVSLMVARGREAYYAHAKNAYQESKAILEKNIKTISAPSDLDDILNQTLMGLAYCAERAAVDKGAEVRKAALEEALNNVIDVYNDSYGSPVKKQNLYWRAQSGTVAIRILKELKQYDKAIVKCRELEIVFPQARVELQGKKEELEKLKENGL